MKEIINKMVDKLFCLHQYSEFERISIVHPNHKNPIGVHVTLICSKCGKTKKIEL